MKLYLEVTRDELELPMIVADSIQELSDKCGTSVGSIKSFISHYKRGDIKHSPYRMVEIDEAPKEIPFLMQCRIKRNLSLKQVAREIGSSAPTVSRVERGEMKKKRDVFDMLCRYYGVTNEIMDEGHK